MRDDAQRSTTLLDFTLSVERHFRARLEAELPMLRKEPSEGVWMLRRPHDGDRGLWVRLVEYDRRTAPSGRQYRSEYEAGCAALEFLDRRVADLRRELEPIFEAWEDDFDGYPLTLRGDAIVDHRPRRASACLGDSHGRPACTT